VTRYIAWAQPLIRMIPAAIATAVPQPASVTEPWLVLHHRNRHWSDWQDDTI
jgi:hypothetical protein